MKDNNYTKMSFETYLKNKQYSNTTITTFERVTKQFLEWLSNENIEEEQVRYQDILAYMKHCSLKRGYSQRSVQHTVIIIRHYFSYLEDIGSVNSNPVKGIKVHGVKRKTLYHIIEPLELASIYENFQAETLSQRKNKVIVGILVFQGLKTEEVDKLTVAHVRLKEGKVQVPGSKQGNGRTLSLEPQQIMDMNEYVSQIRPQILGKSGQRTDRLFVSIEGGSKLRLHFLMGILRNQNAKIEKADQIRASVIVKWLRQYNLRQTQYFAGHRFISSTEAYLPNDMEGLTEEINRFHPLG